MFVMHDENRPAGIDKAELTTRGGSLPRVLRALRDAYFSSPAMQTFKPLSRYLCSKCGTVLRESDMQIETSALAEDCPGCGSLLADTLRRQQPAFKHRLPAPKIQSAYDLMKFRFGSGIAEIDSFMHLGLAGLLCIVGYKANLLLTRLCVTALLPAKYGGLDSPYVLVVDAGNKSDVYQTVNFCQAIRLGLSKCT